MPSVGSGGPRRTDLAALDDDAIREIAKTYNQTPRKCLGFRSPNEIFNEMINRVALET